MFEALKSIKQKLKEPSFTLNHFLDQRVAEKNFHARFVALGQQLSEDFATSTAFIPTDQGSLRKTVVHFEV